MLPPMEQLVRPGNVVRLRERLWRVDQVSDLDFSATPLEGRDTYPRRFLRSLEEGDAKPGQLHLPNPSVVSDPAEQDLLLRAFRLSLIHGSAPFLGLQRSRAVPEPYQLVPLLMSMGHDRVRLLVGDDVGIGKTIEAGLILAELVARGLVRRALVVVPADLREQWQDALDHFFHIEAVVIAGHLLPALERTLLPGQSPWEAFTYVIVSIDYAKKHPGEVLAAKWDMAIVDECHIAARPHQVAGRSGEDMQRYEFLTRLAASVDHLLLLSATPHNGYADSFASLIESLNPAAVNDGRIVRDTAGHHIVQRRRRDIERWYGGANPFPRRDQTERVISISKPEKALFERLRAYTDRLEARGPEAINFWVAAHLQKRALSSPEALRESLKNRRLTILEAIAKKLRQEALASTTPVEAEIEVIDTGLGDDLSDEQRSVRIDTAAVSFDELDEIQAVEALAKPVTPAKDSKLRFLMKDLLPDRLGAHPRARRVLIFTKYYDTLEYLAGHLRRESTKEGSLAGVQIFEIYGEMSQADRRETFRSFEHVDRAVCVATDCISEGLDLQRGCAEIVHYELPWNPNRLEQRNGRVDRYGQPEPFVGLRTLVLDDPLDVAMLELIEKKARAIRDEFGFCPVYLSSGRELRDLMRRYGSPQQTLFPADGAEEESPDPFDRQRIERIRDESFYGQQDVRLPEVERALRETYDTVGSPDEAEQFVQSALNRYNGVLVGPLPDGTFELALPDPRLQDLMPERGKLKVAFDPSIARDDPTVSILDLAHPLVRRLIDLIRDEAAGNERGRFGARATPAAPEVTAVVHALARFVALSRPPVVMEELIPVVTPVYREAPPGVGAGELFAGAASPLSQSTSEVEDAGREALANPAFRGIIGQAVEERRKALEHRQQSIAAAGKEWTAGADVVEMASTDLLTMTLFFPSHGL